jgi:hypothetical protein
LLHLGRVEHWLGLNRETNVDVSIATLKNALDYYGQAINILKIRQTLTKADRSTLIDGTLEMAQLQCNLSMVGVSTSTHTHRFSEERSTPPSPFRIRLTGMVLKLMRLRMTEQ